MRAGGLAGAWVASAESMDCECYREFLVLGDIPGPANVMFKAGAKVCCRRELLGTMG